jgi:hypothetical protein
MLTQKATKAKATGIITMKNAEKIMDKKTKRNYKKMFKDTTRRKQRLLEKQEARQMIDEYNQDQQEG